MAPLTSAIHASKVYDLMVVGGGINGAGIARDASERGISVLLVDQGDFGSGTSAYSTRLIHGGLRYLEHYDIPLVKEALTERNLLLTNASHRVHPLLFGIPTYNTKGSRPQWLIRLGVWAYEALAYWGGEHSALPPSKGYSAKGFLSQFPGVKAQNLKGGITYSDAQVELPERLCLETVLAAEAAGATVRNYTKATQIKIENQQASEVSLRDCLTGEQTIARARVIVNASGPWVDNVLALAKPIFPKLMGGTKGTHLVVAPFPGAPHHALYVEATDGRPYFIIPWLGNYLIGTTDIPYSGSLDSVEPSEGEIEYLLNETNRVIPKAYLQRHQVLYAYAGVRPLPASNAATPAAISRRHQLRSHEDEGVENLFSVVGGKLTTFRQLAEEVVTTLNNRYRWVQSVCTTRHKPLPGAWKGSFPQAKKREAEALFYGVSQETVAHLMRLYGERYSEVLQLTRENPDWKALIQQGYPDIQAQVVHAVRYEHARTVDDFLRRRSLWGLQAGNGVGVVSSIAQQMGALLGWSPKQVNQAADDYQEMVRRLFKPLP
ncbi:MAG: glycerol-3-phosphate dehydrogenase [Vampirovibrionales bacterium]